MLLVRVVNTYVGLITQHFASNLVHVAASWLVIPYVTLAAMFLAVGRVASTKGLWAVIETALQAFLWLMGWGRIGLAVVMVLVIVLDFFASTWLFAHFALAALAGVSLLVLLFVQQGLISSGELLFLMPCALILLYEA